MRVRPTYPIDEPHYPLYRKLSGLQRGSVPCGEDKNILHYPEIEPNIIQLIVQSLNLLSYFGLPVHSHTLLSQATQKRLQSSKLPSYLHERRMAPQSPASATFFIYLPAGIPPPPLPPAPLSLIN